MNPQPESPVAADEQAAGTGVLSDAQLLADLEEDRRLQRELLEAELGGEG
jgi:hypothetical protein